MPMPEKLTNAAEQELFDHGMKAFAAAFFEQSPGLGSLEDMSTAPKKAPEAAEVTTAGAPIVDTASSVVDPLALKAEQAAVTSVPSTAVPIGYKFPGEAEGLQSLGGNSPLDTPAGLEAFERFMRFEDIYPKRRWFRRGKQQAEPIAPAAQAAAWDNIRDEQAVDTTSIRINTEPTEPPVVPQKGDFLRRQGRRLVAAAAAVALVGVGLFAAFNGSSSEKAEAPQTPSTTERSATTWETTSTAPATTPAPTTTISTKAPGATRVPVVARDAVTAPAVQAPTPGKPESEVIFSIDKPGQSLSGVIVEEVFHEEKAINDPAARKVVDYILKTIAGERKVSVDKLDTVFVGQKFDMALTADQRAFIAGLREQMANRTNLAN